MLSKCTVFALDITLYPASASMLDTRQRNVAQQLPACKDNLHNMPPSCRAVSVSHFITARIILPGRQDTHTATADHQTGAFLTAAVRELLLCQNQRHQQLGQVVLAGHPA